MQSLIIVESSCVGAAYTGKAARSLGYRPIFLTDPGFGQGDTHAQMSEFDVFLCDTGSAPAMATALKNQGVNNGFAVVSFCDTNIVASIELAELLGVKSINKAAKALKDKGQVYKSIPEFSPPSIVFKSSRIPFPEIAGLVKQHGRVVIKPAHCAGGHGAFFIDNVDEDSIKNKINMSGIPQHLHPESWLAQAAIDGNLISLEGYSHCHKEVFLGFTGRHKIGMTESVLVFPIDDEIPLHLASQAKQAVTTLLSRSGFTNGYFHVEFIITEKKIYLIDANIGRIGGGGLSEQFAVTFNIAPEKVYEHMLNLSLHAEDKEGHHLYSNTRTKSWSAMYGIPIQAQIRKISLPKKFSNYHTRILEYGTLVMPMGVDNYSWVGIVSGEANNVKTETPEIEIETSEGTFKAVF